MTPRTKNRQMMNLRVITRIATKKEFKAHLPQPSSKDCWRDFEKLEAVAYHKATASEDISEVEAQRLQEAVEAATTTEQTSIGLIQKFMSQSGDPAISGTFREIQMKAATLLLSARNNATRRAARAKEASPKTQQQ
jgi:hypothetical protein